MIDIHSHLLPGIDDGAVDVGQSMALAAHAINDGITHMVFTPHIQPGVYDNAKESIAPALGRFRQALEAHGLKLHTAMAAEVRICPEILSMLDADTIPLFIAADGKRTMLLELPHSHVPPGSDQMIRWLMRNGIQVLIAHPERNKGILKDYSKAEALVNMGCMLQVTSGSLAGRFGAPPQQAARHFLEQGWIDLLASDAHNLKFRPPELSDGRAAVLDVLGEAAALRMVVDAPMALVGGMFVDA